MTRTLLYLICVLPVTWALLYLAALPAAFLLPPDLLQQAILFIPLFCIGGGWIAGRLINRFALPLHQRGPQQRRRAERFVAVLHLGLVVVGFAAIFTGYVTLTEAFVILAVILLAAHAIAFRRWITP